MKNRLADLRAHLRDNTGDENISKMIWIVIVFVVGGLLLTILANAFAEDGVLGDFFDTYFTSWFGGDRGLIPEA